jgi:hypothetical protein
MSARFTGIAMLAAVIGIAVPAAARHSNPGRIRT